MSLAAEGFVEIAESRLEYRMIGPYPDEAATVVLLHEGLGSVGQWGDFPDRLAAATGLGVFAYSRAGYGHSSAATLPRRTSFMHEEACEVLPRVLDAIGFARGILLGHSDGASIAAIYAGSVADHRRSARQARTLALRKWDITEELAHIRVPVLIIQGEDDQYGTLRQVETAKAECQCPVEALILPGVRHVPHREAAGETLRAIVDFIGRLLRPDPPRRHRP